MFARMERGDERKKGMEKKREREEEEEEEVDEAWQKQLDDALLSACWRGFLEDVKKALRSGGSINAVNKDGKNGLSLACRRDDWDVAEPIVKFLLSKRCQPLVPDKDAWNAFHFAARFSSAAIMRLLLDASANVIKASIDVKTTE